jgi:hypothetical protein
LVRRFLAGAEIGCVLRASGEEDEASLEFGVLTQLVAHAPAQRVEPAGRGEDGGVAAGDRSLDPLAAGAALVDLLGQLQRSDAVVLVVDDAQWADRPSLQALTFALRRLRVDRVLAVMVARDVADPRIPDGLRRLVTGESAVRVPLDGLDVDELRELVGLLGVGPLSARGAARLRAHTGGSPLHARALLEQLPAAAFDDAAAPLPAPRAFATLVAARLAGSAPKAERLVAVASVLGMHVPVEVAAAVAQVDDPLPALEQAMAAGLLDPLAGLPEPALASAAELEKILGRGVLRLHTDDLEGALRDLGGVLAAGHDRSATFRWVAASFLTMAEFRAGRWDDAFVHAELALSIATDADQAPLAVFCHQVATLVPVARGEWAVAESHLLVLDAAAGGGLPSPVAIAASARAHLARVRGAAETVVAAYEPLLRPELRYVIEQAAFSWWLGPLFDALITVGDHDRAENLLGPYERRAAERGVPSALAVAGRARGNLAAARGDAVAAEQSFEAALAHAGRVNAPFDRALAQFAYGRFLRRDGKRARAGEQLYAAREEFARLGARPDLARSEHELAACGLSTGPRRRRDAARLTPQELAVARLVASGLTTPPGGSGNGHQRKDRRIPPRARLRQARGQLPIPTRRASGQDIGERARVNAVAAPGSPPHSPLPQPPPPPPPEPSRECTGGPREP